VAIAKPGAIGGAGVRPVEQGLRSPAGGRRSAGARRVVADGDRHGLLSAAGVIGGVAGRAAEHIDGVGGLDRPDDIGGVEGVRVRDDELGGCELEASSFTEMARHIRGLGERTGAPMGAVLEGGYALALALALSVCATMDALAVDEPADSALRRTTSPLEPHPTSGSLEIVNHREQARNRHPADLETSS
jgi:hypothetical protein